MSVLPESSAASYTPGGVSAVTMLCTLADGYSEPQILLQQAGDQCITDQCGCAASLPNDQNLQVQDASRQDHKDNLLRPAPAPAQTKQVRDSLMAGGRSQGQESSSHKQSTVTTILGPWSPCPSGTPAAAALVLVVQSTVKQKGLDQVLLGSSNLFLWTFKNLTCMMS
ncbi:unnamed protein product [Sphagnum tenellum]